MAFLNRAGRVLSVAVTAASLLTARSVAAQPSAENDIKAAFLLNFTRFVDWPPAGAGPIRVCTVADAGFDAVVTRTFGGETSGGRPIVRETPDSPEAARACHILFLSRLDAGRAERWLAAVRGRPVLVVVDTRASDLDAAITFVVEDNRVKFDVDEQAAMRAGLKISSKLLRVARRVTGKSSQ
jgi:uncharacterized protein DUF4154